jgi:chromatin structure-remodeling complex subunit RSC4
MRLGHGERGLCVADIKFLGEEEEESTAEEEQRDEREEEEEEETEAEGAAKNGKKKGKGRGRGRAKGILAKTAGKSKSARSLKRSSKPKMDEIQVKLNGSAAKESEDHGGEWHLDLLLGSNLIEIGEKGGLIWKVFAERVGEQT